MTNLLTVSEVAAYLKTTTTTVYRWLKEGKLRAVKIGKEWRIDESLLKSLINQSDNTGSQGSFWRSLRQNEHIMLITNRNSEVSRFEASFFKMGLNDGARLMKGCWWQDTDEVIEQYTELGLDASSLIKDGILSVLNLGRLFKKEGIDGPVKAWQSSIEKTVSNGIARLWASGSPNMNCCGDDSKLVLAFETKLNEAIKNKPVIGVCPYSLEDESNRENFDKMMMLMDHHSGVAFYSGGQYSLLRR